MPSGDARDELSGEPSSPLVLVRWQDGDGARTVHQWSSYRDLAVAYWNDCRCWLEDTRESATPPDSAAGELIGDIVAVAARDALLVLRALIETAPSADALSFVGAGPMEELFLDPRVDDVQLAAAAALVRTDARWALAAAGMWIDDELPESRQKLMAELGGRRLAGPPPWNRP